MSNILDNMSINVLYFEESFHEITTLVDLNTYSLPNGFVISNIQSKRDFILHYVDDTPWNLSPTKNFITKYYDKTVITLNITEPILINTNVIISQISINVQNNIKYVKIRLSEV